MVMKILRDTVASHNIHEERRNESMFSLTSQRPAQNFRVFTSCQNHVFGRITSPLNQRKDVMQITVAVDPLHGVQVFHSSLLCPVSDASVHVHLHDRQPLPRPVAESGERPWHGGILSHARGLPVPDAHNICGKRVFRSQIICNRNCQASSSNSLCEHCDGMLHVHQQVQPPSEKEAANFC